MTPNPNFLFRLIIISLFLSAGYSSAQDAFKKTRSDSSRSIVFCYIEYTGNMLDTPGIFEKGLPAVIISHSLSQPTDTNDYGVTPEHPKQRYTLKAIRYPVVGSFYQSTWEHPEQETGIAMWHTNYKDGSLLCFINVPAGLFRITRIQREIDKSRYGKCDNCPDVDLLTAVLPGSVTFLGSYEIRQGFKDNRIEDMPGRGKVIVTNFYRIIKDGKMDYTTSIDLETHKMDSPAEPELIKELLDDASGVWETMLKTRLTKLSER